MFAFAVLTIVAVVILVAIVNHYKWDTVETVVYAAFGISLVAIVQALIWSVKNV